MSKRRPTKHEIRTWHERRLAAGLPSHPTLVPLQFARLGYGGRQEHSAESNIASDYKYSCNSMKG